MCKAKGNNNYACGLMETILQTIILPQRLSESLIWNRFANTRGQSDSNIPLDLLIEHENRIFKQDLHCYRGELSQAHLDRLSLSLTARKKIILNVDHELQYYISKGDGSPNLNVEDILLLVEKYKSVDLFTCKNGRAHSLHLAHVKPNPMLYLTHENISTWLSNRLSILKTKPWYKQFHVTQ